MPTVLLVNGWRFHFFTNEENEPIHIHCEKGEKKCKYWLDVDTMEIREEFSRIMSSRDSREVKEILLQNFVEIVQEWNKFFDKK